MYFSESVSFIRLILVFCYFKIFLGTRNRLVARFHNSGKRMKAPHLLLSLYPVNVAKLMRSS